MKIVVTLWNEFVFDQTEELNLNFQTFISKSQISFIPCLQDVLLKVYDPLRVIPRGTRDVTALRPIAGRCATVNTSLSLKIGVGRFVS